MITHFPGVPYAPHVRVAAYQGSGAFVLRPGTIVKKGGYKGPQSISGSVTDPKLTGIYVIVEGDK